MNWLPVVHRELQVAARKRSTFWVRVIAAATWLTLGSGFLLIGQVGGTSPRQIGMQLFLSLVWILLGFALAAGLFLTSDCISEEKREGTLGLLFLTELRGFDVALGKLLSTSLRGVYALLAVLPVIAVTLILGGVTSAQVWKSALALLNALFFSLALGMCVSSLSRDSHKALTWTLLLLLVLIFGGPAADALLAAVGGRRFQAFWSFSSPGYVLVTASTWATSGYVKALGISHCMAWAFFAAASVLVPRTWREKRLGGAGDSRAWSYAWRYGNQRQREDRRRKMLEPHPVAWLGSRERWQARSVWTVAILVLSAFIAALVWNPQRELWILWTYLGGLFTFVIYLWAASQGSRFLLESRRSGWLELLLVSPVSERVIIRGIWRSFARMFGLPLLLLVSVYAGGVVMSQLQFQSFATKIPPATAGAATNTNAGAGTTTSSTNIAGGSTVTTVTVAGGAVASTSTGVGFTATLMVASSGVFAALATLGNLIALLWFGMWMGMTSRTPNTATMKTFLFVQVIPWFVLAFGTSLLIGLVLAPFFMRASSQQPATWIVWYPFLSAVFSGCLALAKDAGFILWSRKKLYSHLREQASRVPGERGTAVQRASGIPPQIPAPPSAPGA